MHRKAPIRALVCTGGAARGTFMAGVVESLIRDTGRDFQILGGVSIGAILTSMMAMAPSARGREGLLEEVEHFRHTFTEGLGRPVSRAVWPLRGMRRRKLTRELIGEHIRPHLIGTSGRKLRVGAVDLRTGQWKVRTERSLTRHSELCGMVAIPGLDPPVNVDGELWVDGAVRRVCPVDEVLELHPDEIIVLTTGQASLGPRPALLGVRRTLGIAIAEFLFEKELRTAQLVERLHGRPRVHVLAPKLRLPSPLAFSAEAMDECYQHGLELGRELLPVDDEEPAINILSRDTARA